MVSSYISIYFIKYQYIMLYPIFFQIKYQLIMLYPIPLNLHSIRDFNFLVRVFSLCHFKCSRVFSLFSQTFSIDWLCSTVVYSILFAMRQCSRATERDTNINRGGNENISIACQLLSRTPRIVRPLQKWSPTVWASSLLSSCIWHCCVCLHRLHVNIWPEPTASTLRSHCAVEMPKRRQT